MDIVFQPSGNFDEVYLYVSTVANEVQQFTYDRFQEELMEADLHAIVSFLFESPKNFAYCNNVISLDSIRPTSDRCPFSVVYISNVMRLEIYPFC